MRSHRYWLLVSLFALALFACPPGDTGTSPTTGDDDDDTPTEEPSPSATPTAIPSPTPTAPPENCSSADVTAVVDNGTYPMDTSAETDDRQGSCEGANGPETVVSFVAAVDAEYIITTDNPGTADAYDTVLYAFTDCANSLGTELACNDDIPGTNIQSRIIIEASAGQTIYVAVDSFAAGGIAELSITTLLCGDGTMVPGYEQCDDGNLVSGDGCSDTCNIDCVDDMDEDNDDPGSATTLGALPLIHPGTLCAEDISPTFGIVSDFYLVDVPAGQVLDGVVGAGSLTDCTQQDLAIDVWDPTVMTFVTSAITNGVNCASFTGAYNPDAASNELLLIVYDPDGGSPPQDFVLDLSSRVPACGDGFLDIGESCDDGNTTDGDGCQANCSFGPVCDFPPGQDLGPLVSGTPLQGFVDLRTEFNTLPDISCTDGNGEDFAFAFSVATPGIINIAVDHNMGDVQYSVFNANDPLCPEVECFDLFPNTSGTLMPNLPVAGDYRLVVETYQPQVGDVVSVTLTAP